MKSRAKKREPEIVYRSGKPAAVIIDIQEYQEMLECLEDAYDLKMLKKMRSKPLRPTKFDEFLKEHSWA